VGVVLGFLLAAAPSWAGYYYDGLQVNKWRGAQCGDSMFRSYVAGVHDLLAGLYPASSHTLQAVADEVTNELLRAGARSGEGPAAWQVVVVLLRMKLIPEEDAFRVLPESTRAEMTKPAKPSY
jgi:hypothetical protein